MDFAHSERAQELLTRVSSFKEREIDPREESYHREMLASDDPWSSVPGVIGELKAKARAEDLWNLFLPAGAQVGGEPFGAGLTNVEYAPLAEQMGRSLIASEVFNCNAPDTGNMEVLLQFGSEAAARALARAAARRLDPLGLLHDRARCRLLGRDEHAGDRGARR